MKKSLLITVSLFCFSVFAEKTAVKIDEISTDKDTSIVIKKGSPPAACLCTKYQLVESAEDISGDSEFDGGKAKASWKAACQEWKTSVKALNKENHLISLSCGQPTESKDSAKISYQSKGTYKTRVKMEEKKSDEN